MTGGYSINLSIPVIELGLALVFISICIGASILIIKVDLYGKRCKDYDKDCVVCKQWENHDRWVKKALEGK